MGTVLWLVYLAGVVASIQAVCVGVLVAGGIALAVGGMICAIEEKLEAYWRVARKAIPWYGLAAVLAVFTPSKTLLYIAAGVHAGSEVAETEIAQKAYRVLDSKLDALLSELPE